MEQNPRQQNELRQSEIKAEVGNQGGEGVFWVGLLHILGLKGFDFFLALKTLTVFPISTPGSSVNADPTYHPECSAQSSSL